ncbi:MAG: hypothetical protein PVJ55_02765 [Anaerolineae bacterium]
MRAARLFDQIAHQVEMERGLPSLAEVPLSFLDPHDMEDILQGRYEEIGPQPAPLPFAVLDLLPRTPVSVEVQTPAGIYVTGLRQLFVSSERPEDDIDTQTILAHAYLHALQDQYFDLRGMKTLAQTTDERLALQALIEGDAMLVTALYRDDDLSSANWERLTDLIIEAEQPGYTDGLTSHDAWVRLRRFPYTEGREFAAYFLEDGGWQSLNSCYGHPPRSTEQILHPSRFLGLDTPGEEPDQPSTVVVPDLGPVLGDGWQLLLKDTLGEFAVRLYLQQALPEKRASSMADGWDGDTLVAWEGEEGRRLVVWRSVWDTNEEAAEFEEGVTLLIPQRHYPAQPVEPPRGLPGRWWETGDGAVHLLRSARHVLLVRGPDTNSVVNTVGQLP